MFFGFQFKCNGYLPFGLQGEEPILLRQEEIVGGRKQSFHFLLKLGTSCQICPQLFKNCTSDGPSVIRGIGGSVHGLYVFSSLIRIQHKQYIISVVGGFVVSLALLWDADHLILIRFFVHVCECVGQGTVCGDSPDFFLSCINY